MKLFRSIVELQNELFEVRKQGKTVGLVPTNGRPSWRTRFTCKA